MRTRSSGSKQVCRSDSNVRSPLIQHWRFWSGCPTFDRECASEPCRQGFLPLYWLSSASTEATPLPSQNLIVFGCALSTICALCSIFFLLSVKESDESRRPYFPSFSPLETVMKPFCWTHLF